MYPLCVALGDCMGFDACTTHHKQLPGSCTCRLLLKAVPLQPGRLFARFLLLASWARARALGTCQTSLTYLNCATAARPFKLFQLFCKRPAAASAFTVTALCWVPRHLLGSPARLPAPKLWLWESHPPIHPSHVRQASRLPPSVCLDACTFGNGVVTAFLMHVRHQPLSTVPSANQATATAQVHAPRAAPCSCCLSVLQHILVCVCVYLHSSPRPSSLPPSPAFVSCPSCTEQLPCHPPRAWGSAAASQSCRHGLSCEWSQCTPPKRSWDGSQVRAVPSARQWVS